MMDGLWMCDTCGNMNIIGVGACPHCGVILPNESDYTRALLSRISSDTATRPATRPVNMTAHPITGHDCVVLHPRNTPYVEGYTELPATLPAPKDEPRTERRLWVALGVTLGLTVFSLIVYLPFAVLFALVSLAFFTMLEVDIPKINFAFWRAFVAESTLVEGEVLASEREVTANGSTILDVAYHFTSPATGEDIRRHEFVKRDDLANSPLPEPGDHLAILYHDDSTFLVM